MALFGSSTAPSPSSLDTSGIALNSVCALLFGVLAMGALLRLVHRHRTSGFPFSMPRWLSHCGRCARSLSEKVCRAVCCCNTCCTDDDADDESCSNRLSATASPNYVHSYLSPRGAGGIIGGDGRLSPYYFAPSASRGARKGYVVMVALLVYGMLRCIQLSLFASEVLDSSGDVHTNMYRFFPALGFMALQSAMLVKWVDHVSELTLALQNQSFGIGSYLIRCSALFFCAEMALTGCALVDVECAHFSHQPPHFWNVLMNMFCGVVYAFNGLSFTGLGCFLWWLWVPVTPMGVHASRRILGIALIFGLMSVTRGAILLMYIDDTTDSQGRVRDVTHNDWGAPSVLLVEWCCLVVSLFLLTVAKSHNNSTLQTTTIGSSLSIVCGADPAAALEQRRREAAASMQHPPGGSSANYYNKPSVSDVSMQQQQQSNGGDALGGGGSSPPRYPSGFNSAVVSPREASARSLRMAMMRGTSLRQGLSSSRSGYSSVAFSALLMSEQQQQQQGSTASAGTAAAAPRNPPNSIQGGSVSSLPSNP